MGRRSAYAAASAILPAPGRPGDLHHGVDGHASCLDDGHSPNPFHTSYSSHTFGPNTSPTDKGATAPRTHRQELRFRGGAKISLIEADFASTSENSRFSNKHLVRQNDWKKLSPCEARERA